MSITKDERYTLPGYTDESQPRAQFLNYIAHISYLSSNSTYGFVVMDLDSQVSNYKHKTLLNIELKCYLGEPKWSQKQQLELNCRYMTDPRFKGCIILQHENKGPFDGYNKIQWFNKSTGNWDQVISGSTNKLTGDNVFTFINKILTITSSVADVNKPNNNILWKL